MESVVKKILCLMLLILIASCASPKKAETVKKNHEGFDSVLSEYNYPFPVSYYTFESQGEKMRMAYMDIKPEGEIKKTIVMLHGKNFGGFYFEPIIKALVARGYRVIAPDQVGFGKSTKPAFFQYSFPELARRTDELLVQAGVKDFTLVGHSMGGMVATRYALLYPAKVKKLVLINPIGLEDYKTLAPYKNVDELYADELKMDETKIRNYQKNAYYDSVWKAEYEPMLVPAIGWTKGPDNAVVARNSAMTTDLIYTQPVVYEFKNLKMPVTMINGQRDKTAPTKAWAPAENQKLMGNYPKLGRDVIKMIPHGKLIPMKGLGHLPFVEDFDGFMKLFVPEL